MLLPTMRFQDSLLLTIEALKSPNRTRKLREEVLSELRPPPPRTPRSISTAVWCIVISMPTPAPHLSPLFSPEWNRVQPLSRGVVPQPKMYVSKIRTSQHHQQAQGLFLPERWHSMSLEPLPVSSAHLTLLDPWPLPQEVSLWEGRPTLPL